MTDFSAAEPVKLTRRQVRVGLVIPFLFWIWIFIDFVSGRIAYNVDTSVNYAIFKYFFNNLFNGVFPLWDPFAYFGVPYLSILSSGFLTPLALPFAFLHFLGLDYYQAYTLYLVGYFALGYLGFYRLAKK